ncbi:MAG: tetratricopeptide repeat protein [Anaerolineae bacterium]|nr:tetratricopeptide repeat protein [Anaerolineae bacterium]
MYLRTPKRYRPGRRKRHLFSMRWLWLWVLTPIVAFGGWQIYQQRDTLRPPVEQAIGNVVEAIGGGIATAVAPTSTPRADPSDRLAAAEGAWTTGAIEEAIDAYEEVLPDVPNDVNVHYRVALGLLMDGRDADGLEAAEGAVNANPYSADAWAIRSFALTENLRPEEGISSALQALNLDRESARATAYLAYAYFEANQIDRAETTVDRALELNPESPEAYFVRGYINHYSRFLLDDAREDYLTALQYAPNMIDVQINLSWLDWAVSNYEDARTRLLSLIELNPNNLDALYALGFVTYQAFGEPQQALDLMERCVGIDPENRACLYYLGNIQRGLNLNAEALETYRSLIALGTEDPRHYLAAARAYLDSAGDCRSAVDLLQRGLTLERSSDAPDVDRMASFEELLQTCGSSAADVSDGTPEAEDLAATPESTPQN